MHILLIHQAFASIDEPGGTRHHEFARYLAGQGHRVSIIASPVSYLTGMNEKVTGSVKKEMDGLITIYRSYTYSALHKSFLHRLFSFFSFMVSSFFTALNIKEVDLVWGTSPPIFQCVTAWVTARVKHVPFLLEVRDLWPAFAVAVGVLRNKTLISMSLWLEKFLYKHADKIIVNSPGYIQHVEEKGGNNITLIPNGADENFFTNANTQDLRKRLGWDEKFVVLYAGAHGMSNDLHTVLETAKLLEGEENILFSFLGDGKEKHNLIESAQALKLKNVQFLDPISKLEISGYLQAANVCLAILKPIALYKTTYPNKVFDYMAASKPILLAIDGVIREVVENAHCGYFCKPGNPQDIANTIRKMQDMNQHQLSELGANGKLYLQQHFERQKIAKTFSDLIEKMGSTNA